MEIFLQSFHPLIGVPENRRQLIVFEKQKVILLNGIVFSNQCNLGSFCLRVATEIVMAENNFLKLREEDSSVSTAVTVQNLKTDRRFGLRDLQEAEKICVVRRTGDVVGYCL